MSLFSDIPHINPFNNLPLVKTSAATRSEQQHLKDFIARYENDPVGMVCEILKAEPLPWQIEFMEKVARGTRRISIRAGHGVGKSTACAWLLIWHMLTRYPQKSVCTAPTAPQLFDALFAELKGWIDKLPEFLRCLLDVKTDRISLNSSPNKSFISARTSSKEKPEALAGIHSEHVLIIVDEASAVDEQVFEAASGSMSGHTAITILISNPTRGSGTFFRSHHELAGTVWQTMHVSCLSDNPLVSQSFLDDMEASYGVDSNRYRVRVLGEFGLSDDDTLIPAGDVDYAMHRTDVIPDEFAPLVFGLDVARQGSDRAVLCLRRGNVVESFRVWRDLNLMQLTGEVVAMARAHKPVEICVDEIGMGYGVRDRLFELGLNVRGVNVSESSAMNPAAFKLRDELWMSVAEALAKKQLKLPDMKDLREELVAPRKTYTSSGKLLVESKDSMKKRGMKSPDIADALCLTYGGTAAGVGGRAPTWIPGQLRRRRIPNVVR